MSICASLGQEISQGKVDHTYKEYMKVNNIINDAGEFILHFEEKDHRDKAISIMIEFYEYMTQKDLTIFPMFGTLLGMIREDDLIPHDGDIDFGYFSWQQDKLIQVLDDLHGKNGFSVIRNQFGDLFSVGKENVLIDLYRYDDTGANSPQLLQGCRRPYDLLKSETLPFSVIEFRGCEMNRLANPEAFFARHYGADWRTPK